MDIKLDISGNNNSFNILKLCLLYFDNITVQIPGTPIKTVQKYYRDTELYPCINEDIVKQLYYLEESNYINVEVTDIDYMFYVKDDLLLHIIEPLAKIITGIQESDNASEIYKKNEIMSNLPLIFQDNTPLYMTLLRYYLFNIYYNFMNNKITISDMQTINNVIDKFCNKNQNHFFKENIKVNCASILLPNLSNATFDDIYEIKYKAKDELIQLRYYIDSLISEFDLNNDNCLENILVNKINPSIKNLEYKMKDLKIDVIQKFLTEIKNPLSYTPLLTTMFFNIPEQLSLLASLGLLSVNMGLGYIKQLNNVKNDNMYFLFKLNKMI